MRLYSVPPFVCRRTTHFGKNYRMSGKNLYALRIGAIIPCGKTRNMRLAGVLIQESTKISMVVNTSRKRSNNIRMDSVSGKRNCFIIGLRWILVCLPKLTRMTRGAFVRDRFNSHRKVRNHSKNLITCMNQTTMPKMYMMSWSRDTMTLAGAMLIASLKSRFFAPFSASNNIFLFNLNRWKIYNHCTFLGKDYNNSVVTNLSNRQKYCTETFYMNALL